MNQYLKGSILSQGFGVFFVSPMVSGSKNILLM